MTIIVQGGRRQSLVASGGRGVAAAPSKQGPKGTPGGGGSGGALLTEGAEVSRSSVQAIVQNANTAVSYDSEARDDKNFHKAANPTRLAASAPGWYIASASQQWEVFTNNGRRLMLRKNGTGEYAMNAVASTANGNTNRNAGAMALYLAATEYLEAVVYQNATADLDLQATTNLMQLARNAQWRGTRAHLTANESIADNTATDIPWDAVDGDTAGFWSAGSPTRFTADATGWHLFSCNVRWETSSGTNPYILTFGVNGTFSHVSQVPTVATFWTTPEHNFALPLYLAAGDYCQARVYHNQGGARLLQDTTVNSASLLQLRGARGATAKLSGTQSLNDSTDTRLAWPAPDRDDDGMYSAGTPTRLTARKAGWHLITAVAVFAANTTGRRSLQLWRNGVNTDCFSVTWTATNNGDGMRTVTRLAYLNVGDYFEANVFQTSGGALNAVAGSHPCRMMMVWLG